MKYKTNNLIGFILLLFSGNTAILAQCGLTISGFADFRYSMPNSDEESSGYDVGQIEIDLATGIGKFTNVEAALAYDPDTEAFGSGAFIIDFHLFGSAGDHLRSVEGLNHSGVLIGQFDVPFGIDWQVYPSIDRKLVSGPLVVENTHDSWNDIGVQAYVEQPLYNFVAYSTNGFGYEYEDSNGTPMKVEMKSALGGRFGFKPYDMLEIGGSYATFRNKDGKPDMTMTGVDFQFNYESLALKGEYISHVQGLETKSVSHSGYYAQAAYDFGKFFLVGRQGLFSSDIDSKNLTRTSVGAGWVFTEGAEIRIEQQLNSENDESLTFIQLVIGF